MKESLRVYYDEQGDFLEISSGKPLLSIAAETQPGVFVRVDELTGDVRSIGILNFKKRSKNKKDINVNLPFEVVFRK